MLFPSALSTRALNSGNLDKFAILLSGIRLLHCLLAPALITVLPVISTSTLVSDELFHQLLLWRVLPTRVIALFSGCRNHKKLSIVGTGFVGIGILVAVAVAGHGVPGSNGEKAATSVACLVLALSHFLNYRACQT